MWLKSSPDLVAFFDRVMESLPNAEKRKMFGYPCCFYKDNLFTGLHQDNWILRLNEEDREHFINTYDASIFEPFSGRKMREYIVLPEIVLEDENLLYHWIEKSYAYAGSLSKGKKNKKTKTA